MAKLLLFDIDGTLILTGGAGGRALDRAFQDVMTLGKASTRITLDGKTDRAIVREIIRVAAQATDNGHDEDGLITQVLERYLAHLQEEVENSPAYKVLPGIAPLLEVLRVDANFVLGLATGNLAPGAKIKLSRGEIFHYFPFGGFGCDSEWRKDIVGTAILRAQKFSGINFLPEEIFVIGDTHHDILAAQAHGVRTIAVATGSYSQNTLANYAPNHLFADLSDHEKFFRALAA